jgi:hypothetical protein
MALELDASKSAGRAHHADRKAHGRSRVTNGNTLLPGIDGRSVWCRRARDIIAAHSSDVPDASHAECSLIRRCAVLTVELERMEAAFAAAGEASPDAIDLYARVASNLRRLLEAISQGTLKRRPRDMGDLDDIDDPAYRVFQEALQRGDDTEAEAESE